MGEFNYYRPTGKKVTDLCIFVDNNITKIINPGENPEIENTIYNYLWLIVKALAIKKGMFSNYQDYDPYAFYSANRLFFALRKNLVNQGKTIKGKLIRPIKSCLNYTKALLNPMKIEFQREEFCEVIEEEFVSKKFNALALQDNLSDGVVQDQTNRQLLAANILGTFKSINGLLDSVLRKSPFSSDSLDYKKIKISILLNCINNLKLGKKLDFETRTLVLWKLPKSIMNYVKILSREFCKKFQKEIMDCYFSSIPDKQTVESILNYREGQDYEYNNDEY